MKLIRFFLPRIEYILFAATFWGIAANGLKILNFDGDLPRHLLNGNLILQSHHVSTTDIFSFRTTGFPSIPHEWLSQVILAQIYGLLGLNGVVLLTALIVMLVWVIVFRDAMFRSNSLLTSLLLTALAMGATQIHILPRPHIFTYILTAAWIWILERIDDNSTHAIWALPLIMLLWVNLHGMFVIGIAIGGIYIVGDFLDRPSRTWFLTTKAKSLMTGGVMTLIATAFSPSGLHIWQTIASLGGSLYITSKIPEYQSANFHLPETWPFIIILLLVMLGFARTNQKVSWVHILLVTAFTGIALYTSRMIPLFAIMVTPIAAEAIAEWIRYDYPKSHILVIEENLSKINSTSNGLIWIFAIILAVGMLFNSGKTIDPENQGNIFNNRFFPVEAVSWLQQHPQNGHVFNEFDWGGYVLLEMWPKYQIFMDGHTHIYGEELTREYEQVATAGKDWEDILNKYQVEWALVRTGSPIARVLRSNFAWQMIYEDNTAVILQKQNK